MIEDRVSLRCEKIFKLIAKFTFRLPNLAAVTAAGAKAYLYRRPTPHHTCPVHAHVGASARFASESRAAEAEPQI